MEFSPFDRSHWDDPYPAYRVLRDQAGLHFSRAAEVFCVTRFDEAAEVFKQPELFLSRPGFSHLIMGSWQTIGARDVAEMLRFMIRSRTNPLKLRGAPESIITSDPPQHGPLRQIVNRGFTPRRIAAWETRIREISESHAAALDRTDSFDVVEKFAHPLPMTVIAEMLGVDAERLSDFRRWSNGVIDSFTGGERASSPGPMLANGGELFRYLRSVIDDRCKAPRDDLISVLVDPSHGETLDTQAVLLFATVLLVAGNETTTNAVGSAVELLLRRRDVLAAVAKDARLIPNLVEECIRLESPFRFMPRQAARDTVIRGTPIPKGGNILVMIGAANRDERRFPDPDRFDLHRDTSGHLGFGFGIHFCLGASLARLEARVALETLIPRLHDLELCEQGSVRSDSFFTRGFARLEVARSTTDAVA